MVDSVQTTYQAHDFDDDYDDDDDDDGIQGYQVHGVDDGGEAEGDHQG